MESMVERVARSLCRVRRLEQGFVSRPDYTLEHEIANAWDLFIPDATAAIEAMKSPTDDMLRAPARNVWFDQDDSDLPIVRGFWEAMIDAALTPKDA